MHKQHSVFQQKGTWTWIRFAVKNFIIEEKHNWHCSEMCLSVSSMQCFDIWYAFKLMELMDLLLKLFFFICIVFVLFLFLSSSVKHAVKVLAVHLPPSATVRVSLLKHLENHSTIPSGHTNSFLQSLESHDHNSSELILFLFFSNYHKWLTSFSSHHLVSLDGLPFAVSKDLL